MVDRQYEIMKRDRVRHMEESSNSLSKQTMSVAETEAPVPAPSQPTLPPPTSAPPPLESSNSQEVSLDFFAIT